MLPHLTAAGALGFGLYHGAEWSNHEQSFSKGHNVHRSVKVCPRHRRHKLNHQYWLEARLKAISLVEHPLQGVLKLSRRSRRHLHRLCKHVRQIVCFCCEFVTVDYIGVFEKVETTRVQVRRYGIPRIRVGSVLRVLGTFIPRHIAFMSLSRLRCYYLDLI